LKKKSTYSPLQKVEINDYGHADFAIISAEIVLSIFGGQNCHAKDCRASVAVVGAPPSILSIFLAVKMARNNASSQK
jgi:hypothetical protein